MHLFLLAQVAAANPAIANEPTPMGRMLVALIAFACALILILIAWVGTKVRGEHVSTQRTVWEQLRDKIWFVVEAVASTAVVAMSEKLKVAAADGRIDEKERAALWPEFQSVVVDALKAAGVTVTPAILEIAKGVFNASVGAAEARVIGAIRRTAVPSVPLDQAMVRTAVMENP